jgi:hypothetical protein
MLRGALGITELASGRDGVWHDGADGMVTDNHLPPPGATMFGRGKKKERSASAPPSPPTPTPGPAPSMDLRRDGVGFADVTDDDAVDAAVAGGRLELFYVMSPMFLPDADVPGNVLAGPPGVAAVKDWIDDQVVAVIDRGGNVQADVDFAYDDGGSRVPRSITFALGDAGTHTLRFW